MKTRILLRQNIPFVVDLIKFGNFQAVKKVDQAIRGKGNRRLKDLDMMTVFAHTGPNEMLNSLRNKVNF